MRPRHFRPNKRTLPNEIFAKLQYLVLGIGYWKANGKIRMNGW
jgi:hypothetical protein